MKFGLYAIKDELTEFAPVTTLKDDSVARRWFALQQVEAPSIRFKPQDYSLWAIGEYDSNTGIITGYAVPTLLERGNANVRIENPETIHE